MTKSCYPIYQYHSSFKMGELKALKSRSVFCFCFFLFNNHNYNLTKESLITLILPRKLMIGNKTAFFQTFLKDIWFGFPILRCLFYIFCLILRFCTSNMTSISVYTFRTATVVYVNSVCLNAPWPFTKNNLIIFNLSFQFYIIFCLNWNLRKVLIL